MPVAGVVASKVRKQRAAAQSLKDNKEGEGKAKRKETEVCGYQLFINVAHTNHLKFKFKLEGLALALFLLKIFPRYLEEAHAQDGATRGTPG